MQLARKGSGSFLAPASQSGCGECYAIWRLDGMSGPALSDQYARESDVCAWLPSVERERVAGPRTRGRRRTVRAAADSTEAHWVAGRRQDGETVIIAMAGTQKR